MFSVSTGYTIFRLFIGVLEDAEYTEQSAVEFSRRVDELLFPELQKSSSLLVCSKSRSLETLWISYGMHWVNTECFGPAVFIYEIFFRVPFVAIIAVVADSPRRFSP